MGLQQMAPLGGNLPVSVNNTPAVTVSGTPAVTISGTPAVTISGTVTTSGGGGLLYRAPVVSILAVGGATAYTIGDRIAASASSTATVPLDLLFTHPSGAGKGGYLVGINVGCANSAIAISLRVHVYNLSQPTTALPGDNGAMGFAFANFGDRCFFVDLQTTAQEATGSDNADAPDYNLRMPFVCVPASSFIYIALQTLTGVTLGAGLQFKVDTMWDLYT